MSSAVEKDTRLSGSGSSIRRTGLMNGGKYLTSYRHNGHNTLPVQNDPLIQSLDEEEEIEEWLNNIVASHKNSGDPLMSALQLRGIDSHTGVSSSPPRWTSSASLEGYLSSLSTTLSFARQDTMAIIDNTIEEVSNTIPRLGLELRLMKDAALTLKSNVDRLRMLSQGDFSNTSSSTQTASAALERLSALSMLHSRMSSARDVLSLAESWSTLTADVTSFLNEAKLLRASSRLAEAKKTLTVFERTPEYESRKALLEGLCESLVNGVKPSLEIAVKEKDLQKSQELASTLASIGKEDQFAKIWHSTRTEYWLSQWKSVKENGGVNDGFIRILPKLIAAFLDLLSEEKLFAPSLYPTNPRHSMESFIALTFSELDPSIELRISDAVRFRHHDGRSILAIVEIYTLLREAISSIADILASVEVSSGSNTNLKTPMLNSGSHVYQHSPSAISPSKESSKQLGHTLLSPRSPNHTRPRQGSHNRRSSRRLSIPNTKSMGSVNDVFDDPSPQGSVQIKASPMEIFLSHLPDVLYWERAILQPMLEWQVESNKMERDLITATRRDQVHLASLKTNDATFFGSEISNLLVVDAINAKELSKDACRRNIQLTFGFTADGLVSCCDEVFCDLLDDFKRIFDSQAGSIVEHARKEAGCRRDGEREEVGESPVEEHQWRSFEDGVSLLSSLHQVEGTIVETEKMIALQSRDTAEILLAAGSPAANEAILRINGNYSSKAPLAFLARHMQDHLQSSNLIGTLLKVRNMTKDTRSGLSRDESSSILFVEAHSTLQKRVKNVQQHLIDVTLAPLLAHMEIYTQLPIWQASRLPGSVNEYELAMPTFSLSPTEEMSKIGEGLLNLPRLLEVWSDNQTLRWAIQALPFIITEEEKGANSSMNIDNNEVNTSPSNKRTSFIAATATTTTTAASSTANPSASPTSERRQTLHRHTSSLAAIATQTGNNSVTSPATDQSEANATTSSATMLQLYLSSIALSLVSHIVSLVLPSIIKLTTAGSLQLVADLEYLLNILSALNVNSMAIAAITSINSNNNTQAVLLIRTLEAWKDSCKLKDADGQRIMTHIRNGSMARGVELLGVEGFEEDSERLNSLAGTQVFDMVAKMRSW